MARAVSCPRCNKRLPEEAHFCRRCGTGLQGRSAAPVAAPIARPPLVAMGYDSPLSPWQGPAEASPMLGCEPRGKRRSKRPKPVAPRASSAKGWWLVLLVGFLSFRACSSFTSHRRSDPPRYYTPAPPIRTVPNDQRMRPAPEDASPAQDESHGTAPAEQGNPFTSP